MSTNPPTPSKTVIIGLSGPSSSGKTTLARLLRQIFNVSVSDTTTKNTSTTPRSEGLTNGETLSPSSDSTTQHQNQGRGRIRTIKLFILHEDDFYKTDVLIPRNTFTSPTYGTRILEDWDCVGSLDLPLLSSTLKHIKAYGVLPDEMVSKEDQNSVGESGVSREIVEGLRGGVIEWLSGKRSGSGSSVDSDGSRSLNGDGKGEGGVDVTICVLDGFLLYPSPDSGPGTQKGELLDMIDDAMDAKLFIPSTRDRTIDRRTKRTGYVTLEGFWEDPEGYVEDVVWPNFREDHGWLFGKGSRQDGGGDDAEVIKRVDEGKVDRTVAEAAGISIGPGVGEVHLRDILPWAANSVRDAIENKVR